jgi:mono/diheme cytochrome c family protein
MALSGALVAGAGAAVIAACGSAAVRTTPTAPTVPTAPTTPAVPAAPTAPARKPLLAGAPAGLSAAERREFAAGREVAQASGCSECHEIDGRGRAVPGPDLSAIGVRLPPAAIARELRDPTAPMPSYRSLPTPRLRALVAYLSRLRTPPAPGPGRVVGINAGRP